MPWGASTAENLSYKATWGASHARGASKAPWGPSPARGVPLERRGALPVRETCLRSAPGRLPCDRGALGAPKGAPRRSGSTLFAREANPCALAVLSHTGRVFCLALRFSPAAWNYVLLSRCLFDLIRRLRILSQRFVLPRGFPQQVYRRKIPQQTCRQERCTPQPWSPQPLRSCSQFLNCRPPSSPQPLRGVTRLSLHRVNDSLQ